MKNFIRTSLMTDAEFQAFVCAHPVSGGKGDNTIKLQEQQQAGFNQQLRSVFGQQFGAQSSILANLNSKLQSQINSPQGFTPAQMAALNTNNTEGAAKDYAQAQAATNAATAARGGSTLPSGVDAQLAAENANAGATQRAQGTNQIQLANAAQQQSNYWNAVGADSQVAQMENPTPYAGSYNQGSEAVGSLGQAYNQTQQSQLEAVLGGVAAAAAGAGSKAAMGGGGCWIAAAVFGEDLLTGPKTNAVRNFLWNEWSRNWYAKPILTLYTQFGQWVAKKPVLVRLLTPLFHLALKKSQEIG